MKKDFLVDMGYSGLTARLKRLNDQFVYQTKAFYKAKGVEIDPNWHMIFLLLIKYEALTVMEIAEYLNLSHPAIVKLVNKMKTKGYITSTRDQHDKRKFQISLSRKGKKELPKLQTYWEAGIIAIAEMMNGDPALLEQLEVVEKNMETQDYTGRMEHHYQKLKNKA